MNNLSILRFINIRNTFFDGPATTTSDLIDYVLELSAKCCIQELCYNEYKSTPHDSSSTLRLNTTHSTARNHANAD